MGENDAEKARQLEALDQQLEKVRASQPNVTPEAKLPGDAAKPAIDFASAAAVGTVLGYAFDRWQHTLPWGLLVGLLIGTVAGFKLMFTESVRQHRAPDDNKTKQ